MQTSRDIKSVRKKIGHQVGHDTICEAVTFVFPAPCIVEVLNPSCRMTTTASLVTRASHHQVTGTNLAGPPFAAAWRATQ